ncbi:hypothetical protein K2X30_07325 [bacterium]|jgi:DNA repair protein RadC|nr:hypothetical protein [bacterium]
MQKSSGLFFALGKTMLRTVPLDERPRERCLEQGTACLSLRECLAILLGSGPRSVGCMGIAQKILDQLGTYLSPKEQERAYFLRLEEGFTPKSFSISGLGDAGTARLMVAMELGKRYAGFRENEKRPTGLRLKQSDLNRLAVQTVPSSLRNSPTEWMAFVPFYRSGNLGDFNLLEKGGRSQVSLDPQELFARVLALRPQGFFLFHNHPSGDLSPSIEDLALTANVKRVCNDLGLQFLGHGILTSVQENWIKL